MEFLDGFHAANEKSIFYYFKLSTLELYHHNISFNSNYLFPNTGSLTVYIYFHPSSENIRVARKKCSSSVDNLASLPSTPIYFVNLCKRI